MPFIRHSRDKRGFESTYVMHAYRPAQNGPHRTRVLYVFHSPANVRVGRRPLDAEVMEALEHTHPDLTFDWNALHRESGASRPEPREREPYRDRPRGARSARRPPPVPARPVEPVPAPQPAVPAAEIEVNDRTVLAVTLGAPEAVRLRRRYEEVLQRIGRRARSAEERDRLVEAARRLNPDEWADEAAVRAGAQTVEGEWDALLSGLPSRRRGRRGGRRRPSGAIMGTHASTSVDPDHAQLDGSTRASGDSDDGGGVGAAAPQPDADFHGED